jgi:NitT/TauT family transport system substrate-binding protein
LSTLRLRAAALLGAAITVAACAGSAATNAPATNPPASSQPGASAGAQACADLGQINLGWHSVSQSVWPMWIAEEQGLFDKYGLDATLINAEGARILSGVISKSTPIAFASGADILDPIAEGADIVAIYAFEDGTPTDMIVGGEGITKAEDLRGKIAGANELGGESDSLVRLGLRELGLEPDVDTRVVSVGGESTRIAALAAGQVQATLVDAGLRNQMEEQGFNILYDFTESDFELLKSAVITTRSYAQDNPEIVQCTVNALVEALEFWKTNKEETVATAVKFSGDMDQADVEGLYDLYVDTLPDQPTVNADALAAHQELSEEQRIKDIDVTTVIDNSFVENAQLKD